MINIISRLFRHILAIGQVDHTKNNSRNRQYGKKQNFSPRVQKDGSEQDSRHSTRSAYRHIIGIISTTGQIIKGSSNHPTKIQS